MNPVTSVLTNHTALVLLSSNIYQNSGGMEKKTQPCPPTIFVMAILIL